MYKYTLSIILSVLLQSYAYGFMTRNMGTSAILFFVMMAFIACSVVYFILMRIRKLTVKKEHIPCLIGLNISTALAFVAFYVSISLIPASISALVEAAAGPIWIVMLSLLIYKKSVSWSAIMTSLLILICGVVALRLQNGSVIDFNTVSGILLAIAAALGAALVAWNSEKAESAGIKPVVVLAWRFHLTWLISLILLMTFPSEKIAFSDAIRSLGLVLIGVVLPMYFMQLGMQRSSPLVTMMCLSMLPLITYMFEMLFGGEFTLQLLSVLIIGTGASFLQIWLNSRATA